jgi:hypothetical protein
MASSSVKFCRKPRTALPMISTQRYCLPASPIADAAQFGLLLQPPFAALLHSVRCWHLSMFPLPFQAARSWLQLQRERERRERGGVHHCVSVADTPTPPCRAQQQMKQRERGGVRVKTGRLTGIRWMQLQYLFNLCNHCYQPSV